ncbi:arylamine N-acetyltransferase [Novosphingobium colocasiae]
MGAVAEDDLEQANHWTSTRPGTRFTTLCVASIPQPQGFASMVDRYLTVHGPEGTQQREIADAADYARTLREVFFGSRWRKWRRRGCRSSPFRRRGRIQLCDADPVLIACGSNAAFPETPTLRMIPLTSLRPGDKLDGRCSLFQ